MRLWVSSRDFSLPRHFGALLPLCPSSRPPTIDESSSSLETNTQNTFKLHRSFRFFHKLQLESKFQLFETYLQSTRALLVRPPPPHTSVDEKDYSVTVDVASAT